MVSTTKLERELKELRKKEVRRIKRKKLKSEIRAIKFRKTIKFGKALGRGLSKTGKGLAVTAKQVSKIRPPIERAPRLTKKQKKKLRKAGTVTRQEPFQDVLSTIRNL